MCKGHTVRTGQEERRGKIPVQNFRRTIASKYICVYVCAYHGIKVRDFVKVNLQRVPGSMRDEGGI